MENWRAIFDSSAPFDAAVGVEPTLKLVPPRWAVYLLTDQSDLPIQLLCVKNLRASVKRRLGPSELPPVGDASPVMLSRRADLREIVKTIHYRRADSALEADWIYLRGARAIFPDRYRDIVGHRPAWFVHVDPNANFPQWCRDTTLDETAGTYIGPIREKGEAARLIEALQDLFDLCRYHHILQESPGGLPCAYKDMGKCPAPCDGSAPMQQYRQMVAWSLATLIDPKNEIASQQERMRAAAIEMKYEMAGKIKAFIDGLSALHKGPYRLLRPLENFRYLAVQPGPKADTARLFACTPNAIAPLLCVSGKPASLAAACVEGLRTAPLSAHDGLSPEDRIGLVTAHLFKPKDGAVYLHADELTDKSLERAIAAVAKSAALMPLSAEEGDDEGILKELGAD